MKLYAPNYLFVKRKLCSVLRQRAILSLKFLAIILIILYQLTKIEVPGYYTFLKYTEYKFSKAKCTWDDNYKQEDQVALNRSPEFCLNVTYRYLLNAGHSSDDA